MVVDPSQQDSGDPASPGAEKVVSKVDRPEFLRWGFTQLNCTVQAQKDDNCEFELTEDLDERWPDDKAKVFTCNDNCHAGNGQANGCRPIMPEADLINWVVDQLDRQSPLPHARPVNDPEAIHQISGELFRHYQVDGGHVQLAGCQFEARPMLRLIYRCHHEAEGSLQQIFVDRGGEPVAVDVVESLNLDRLEPLRTKPTGGPYTRGLAWIQSAINESHVRLSGARECELLHVTLVWCQFANVKLEFQVGESSAIISFAGWAQQLANGGQLPPPFKCREADVESYHVACTDDGQIAPLEAIGECQCSGKRVLKTALRTCAVTGTIAQPQFMSTCPVTGDTLLKDRHVKCGQCHQEVSPRAMTQGICSICRDLTPVSSGDASLARVLGEYPGLDQWRNWKLGESTKAYVLLATGWMRQLLVVLEKETLAVLRVAEKSRFGKEWTEVTSLTRQELLG